MQEPWRYSRPLILEGLSLLRYMMSNMVPSRYK